MDRSILMAVIRTAEGRVINNPVLSVLIIDAKIKYFPNTDRRYASNGY